MDFIILALTLLVAFYISLRLVIIDAVWRILPDQDVLILAMCGLIIHVLTHPAPNWADMAYGAVVGSGFLFGLHMLAPVFVKNPSKQYDLLGLGDVKLIAALGIWVGLSHIFLVIAVGAFATLIFGVLWAKLIDKVNWKDLQALYIPAGPGFIIATIILYLYGFIHA